MKKSSFRKGFTIIELMVTLSILGILGFAALPTYNKFKNHSEKEICIANRNALMRQYEICKNFNGDEVTLEKFINGDYPEYYNKNLNEYNCPNSLGSFVVEDNKLVCTFHDKGIIDPSEPPTPPDPPIVDGDPGWNKNYDYGSPGQIYPIYNNYDDSVQYEYGYIVHSPIDDGLIYRCIKTGEKDPRGIFYNSNANNFYNDLAVWEIIGSSKGDLPFWSGAIYGIGTIVEYGKEYYMYTPIDDNRRYPGFPPEYQWDWTKITDNNNDDNEDRGYLKPPKVTEVYSDAEPIKGWTRYVAGNYYTDYEGRVYRFNHGKKSPPNSKTISNGNWTSVTNGIYYYHNAKYNRGEEVWYNGTKYRAKLTFTTDWTYYSTPPEKDLWGDYPYSYYWEPLN